MLYLWIILGVLLFLALAAVAIAWVCFKIAFHVPKKRPVSTEEFPIPKGNVYEPFRDDMVNWMKEVRAMPSETFSITSFDGLRLQGKFYAYAPGAPIELMFHGYRGNAERDLCGAFSVASPWATAPFWWISAPAAAAKAPLSPLVSTSTKTATPGWIS